MFYALAKDKEGKTKVLELEGAYRLKAEIHANELASLHGLKIQEIHKFKNKR